MKIGFTKLKKPEKSEDGKRTYEYTIWFRTSDGELHNRRATADVNIVNLIEVVAAEEAEVHMDNTDEEVTREKFLQEI